VKIRLVPKGHDYFGAFSKLAANLETSAQLFQRFLSDYDNRKSRAGEILEHEHIGDQLVHDVVHELNNSFITPIDREDIYALVTTQDEILDHIEATADAMILYKVEAPTPQLIRQADIVAEATKVLREAIDCIEDRPKVRERVVEVNRLENDGDRVARDAIAGLFNDSMSCTDIIKWKDIYELMETAIDDCEHVANILESIVLKNH
jgi:predicted phosphate transport protein (TIGR00153 family)